MELMSDASGIHSRSSYANQHARMEQTHDMVDEILQYL